MTEYKPAKTWESFYTINKSLIDNEVELIKKQAVLISDKKNRDKYFEREMRALKNMLIQIWNKTKL